MRLIKTLNFMNKMNLFHISNNLELKRALSYKIILTQFLRQTKIHIQHLIINYFYKKQ